MQLGNAAGPMVVVLDPISTYASDEHAANALFPMDVIWWRTSGDHV